MRKLVTIRCIGALLPIDGADFIEIALVDDWQVVVKKGEFNFGDSCVFFEIDSMLPDEPRYSFLGTPKKYLIDDRHRLKTMKLRKVISQGLALPLSSFPEIHQGFKLGDDVTDILKVVKYEPEQTTGGSTKQSPGSTQDRFPSFLPKTDQERIQNLTSYYERYKDHQWEETLKLDGSSMTVFKIHQKLNLWQRIKESLGFKQEAVKLGVCSRNLELRPNDSDFWKMTNKYKLAEYLPVGYAVQGEVIGPRIQANHEKVQELDFYVFDIYDITNGKYLLPVERTEFFEEYFSFAKCDIKHVPVVSASCKVFEVCTNLQELQERVTGPSMNKGTVSEGRVYKSTTIPGLSFKCISNEYLLKKKD